MTPNRATSQPACEHPSYSQTDTTTTTTRNQWAQSFRDRFMFREPYTPTKRTPTLSPSKSSTPRPKPPRRRKPAAIPPSTTVHSSQTSPTTTSLNRKSPQSLSAASLLASPLKASTSTPTSSPFFPQTPQKKYSDRTAHLSCLTVSDSCVVLSLFDSLESLDSYECKSSATTRRSSHHSKYYSNQLPEIVVADSRSASPILSHRSSFRKKAINSHSVNPTSCQNSPSINVIPNKISFRNTQLESGRGFETPKRDRAAPDSDNFSQTVTADEPTGNKVKKTPSRSRTVEPMPCQNVLSNQRIRVTHSEVDEGRASKRCRKRKRASQLEDLSLTEWANDDSVGDEPRSPPKKKPPRRYYAPPEIYADVPELEDILSENLDVMFCGINPGNSSAKIRRHFGHATNHFWYCLEHSGFINEPAANFDPRRLPKEFGIGLTNLVRRPTFEQSELCRGEQIASFYTLLSKVWHYRPRIVCLLGLGMARLIRGQLKLLKPDGTKLKVSQTKAGLQVYKILHPARDGHATEVRETLFYALPSTSARVIVPQRDGKAVLFRELRHFLRDLKSKKKDTEDLAILTTSCL